MAEQVHVRIHPELRQLAVRDALAEGLTLNELLAKILAERYERPDLAEIPRKKLGRPPKEAISA